MQKESPAPDVMPVWNKETSNLIAGLVYEYECFYGVLMIKYEMETFYINCFVLWRFYHFHDQQYD